MMMTTEYDQDIAVLEAEIAEISPKYAELQARILDLHTQLKPLIEKRDNILCRKYPLPGPITEDEIDLVLRSGIDESSMPKHYAATRIAEKKLSLSRWGYSVKTLQAILRIALTQGDSEYTKKVTHGIRTILPHIVPITETFEYGRMVVTGKRFGISTTTDEAQFMITDDGKFYVGRLQGPILVFDDLESAMTHIEQNLYAYQKGT